MIKSFYVGSANAESYQFNRAGLFGILKVLGWSVGSTIIASLIALIPNIDIPTQWLFLVPIVNTLLVAVNNFIKSEKSQE